MATVSDQGWRRACESAACVEWRRVGGMVQVRESDGDADRPWLIFTPEEVDAFAAAWASDKR